MNRDRTPAVYTGFYEAVKDEFWRAENEGRAPGLKWQVAPGHDSYLPFYSKIAMEIRRDTRMPKSERKSRKTMDALKILDRMIGDDVEVRQQADEALINAEVAQLIYDARTKAKLTQNQLAKLIGTTQSVIARLEDADYEGHSLSMLQRIASALHKRLEIRFVSGHRRMAA